MRSRIRTSLIGISVFITIIGAVYGFSTKQREDTMAFTFSAGLQLNAVRCHISHKQRVLDQGGQLSDVIPAAELQSIAKAAINSCANEQINIPAELLKTSTEALYISPNLTLPYELAKRALQTVDDEKPDCGELGKALLMACPCTVSASVVANDRELQKQIAAMCLGDSQPGFTPPTE